MRLYLMFIDWVDPKFWKSGEQLQDGVTWPLLKNAPKQAVNAYRQWLKAQKYARENNITID